MLFNGDRVSGGEGGRFRKPLVGTAVLGPYSLRTREQGEPSYSIRGPDQAGCGTLATGSP